MGRKKKKEQKDKPSETIMNTDGICFSFIYYPNKDKNFFNYFLSYRPRNEEETEFDPYLDFDRIITIPDSVDDENVESWIKENWKVGTNSYNNNISDDGILFLCKEGNTSYLVKRMSEITKEKIKLLYLDFTLDICGEYLAYPDKDGVHMVYKPIFEQTPHAILHEIRSKMGFGFSMDDDWTAPPLKNSQNAIDESGS
jgi:hypothetical protein